MLDNNAKTKLRCPMTQIAWATPIVSLNPQGLISPVEFVDDLPQPPQTNAVFTFLDGDGNVVPQPSYTERYLPPYCFVQYVDELPPPPPPGYRYLKSELNKNMASQAYHIYHMVGNPRPGIDTLNPMEFVPFELTPQQHSGMVSALVEHPDGYFSTDTGVLVSNFIIETHRVIRICGTKGIQNEKLEYSVKTKLGRKAPRSLIDVENLDKLPELVRSKVPGCMININVSKVDSQIVFHVRNTLLNLPCVNKYCNSGWTKINGVWVYAQDNVKLSGAGCVFDTGFRISANPALSASAAMSSAMGMLGISNQPQVIVPLVMYAHLGVLFTLFEEAGYAPRMLMFVNGKTGSLKTAVCSVLYNLTGESKNNIPATFRDSVASVEAKFPNYTDQVLLLDDYSPATTARNRADMNKLLEDVIRYYGDGKGRGRSNAKVTQSTTSVPRGLCCITGEDTGGSQSSMLRCILINVSNGVFNGEILSPYQRDPSLWTTHFSYFVDSISRNFDVLLCDIQNCFPMLRDKLRSNLTAGRIIDSAIYLLLAAKILLRYGLSIGWTTDSNAVEQLAVWEKAIIEALKISEEASSELDPVRFYIITVLEAVDSNEEIISPNREIFLDNPNVLGYNKNGKWHIWPDKAYSLVTKHCNLQRRSFPLSMKKIHAALAEAHLIDVTEDNRSQVNYLYRETFGSRPRTLVLDIEAAQQYLDS